MFADSGNKSSTILKPFVFKMRDGFLVGLAPEAREGAPCSGCVEAWLKGRNVWVERAHVGDLIVRKDLLAELLTENCAHVMYEISNDGTHTRMDCVVFPHPQCVCNQKNYIAPKVMGKKSNYAFSPIFQIKCARFGTPDGNLWLTNCMGECPRSKRVVSTFAVARDKEASRKKAIEKWLRKAANDSLLERIAGGESVASEIFQTGGREILSKHNLIPTNNQTMGVGVNQEAALLDAFQQLAMHRTVRKYGSSTRNPMLIVGANNWIRTRVPFFLLQQYDLHLLFYPNPMQVWVVGLAAFSRLRTDELPIFVFASDADVKVAMDEVLCRIVEECRPAEWLNEPEATDPELAQKNSRLNLWWTHWIYRCSKISLTDVLHLEPYQRSLFEWRNFFVDGEPPVSIVSANDLHLPAAIRTLIRVELPLVNTQMVRNAVGIGTWATFRDSLS